MTNQGCADRITVQVFDGSDGKFLVVYGAFVVGEIVDGIGLLAVPLPPAYNEKSACWTSNRWTWYQY